MSGSTATLWRLLNEREPLFIVLYASPAALSDTLDTISLMAPGGWKSERTHSVEDAFVKLNVPLLLTPTDEASAVLDLDGRREALLDRTSPAVLFLLKGGSGEQALRAAPGLASWVRA